MSFLISKIIPARMENVHEAMGFVTSFAQKFGLPPDRILAVEMSVEEALVNIINYAFPEGKGNFTISCINNSADMFIVEITDEGIPFDVLAKNDPDVTLGIEERQIGGLGIFLMKKLMDEVKYKRENGKNILTLMVIKK